jgi:hypothetical protein
MTSMELGGWDPLEAAEATDKDVLAAAKKREIKNILKSYVSNYDPFSELIQNAMDAAEKRASIEDEVTPKVSILINLQENFVEVIDNGVGFEQAEFRSFLAPNISFKSGGRTRGNKGVGVTYIAYGFNDLTIRTKNKHFSFEGRMRRGREWIEDTSGTISRPVVEKAADASPEFEALDQGTSFKIVFSGNHVRPSNLAWYQAQDPEQWMYLLLVKTPLGAINLPSLKKADMSCDIIVVDKKGDRKTSNDVDVQYKYPHNEIKASSNLSDIMSVQTKAIQAGKDPAKAVNKYKKSNGLYKIYKTEDLKEVAKFSEEQIDLMDEYGVTGYGYFAYSTEVWDQLNDNKAKLRKGLRILRGGLQISCNRMTQGELVTIPLTKSIGHQNQTHVLIHFDGAEPDLGRKGFQPELEQLAEVLSVGIVRQLSARRNEFLKSDSGAQADIEKEIAVHEWLKDLEKHEADNPLELKSEKFFLPTKKISVSCVPKTEQDVIVLFNQLLAGGVIRGIRLLSTSQSSQYDGVFRFVAEEPLSNLVFDEEKNPLGVHEEGLTKSYKTPPKVLEYKFNLDGLIREFESEYKHENDVDLAVFWEMGNEFKKEYDILSYLDFDHTHRRQHHGLTHQLSSANSRFEVICLKELLDLLNSPAASQKFQKDAYGDEI